MTSPLPSCCSCYLVLPFLRAPYGLIDPGRSVCGIKNHLFTVPVWRKALVVMADHDLLDITNICRKELQMPVVVTRSHARRRCSCKVL